MRNYTVTAGVYTFPFDGFQIRVKKPHWDRHGRVYGDVEVVTQDGEGYLATGNGDLQAGRFQGELARQAAKRNSGDTLAIENAVMAVYLAIREDPNVAEQLPAPSFQSAPDFMRGVPPPSPAVVDGLLVRGGLYTIAARPKTGKSILLLNLAIAIATGCNWLGRRVERGRVLMFLLEDSPRTIKQRLEAMCPSGAPGDLLIHAETFRLAEENYDATVKACRGAALVIVDPVIQASEVKDWNSQQEVRDTFDLWRRLARETEACQALSYHHRKMAGDFGDAMAGSVQAQATVDGILELYRDRKLQTIERKVTFIGRDWPDLQDEVVALDTETLIWQPKGTYAEAKQDVRDAEREQRAVSVADILPEQGPGVSRKDIQEKTGLSERTVRETLEDLGDSLQQSGQGVSGDPYRFWKQ